MGAIDPVSIKQAVDGAAAALGGLDILVNNAGIWRAGPIDQLALDDIDATLAVNVRSVILASQAALAHMSEGGRIISIGSSPAARRPHAGISLFSARTSPLNAR